MNSCYRSTFPSDWETNKTLGDLFDFNNSLSNSREELGEEGIPYLHYGDMHRELFTVASYDRYSRLPKIDTPLSGKEKCLLKDGDVVFLDASEDLEGTSRCVLIDNPDNLPFFAGLHTIPAREKGGAFSKLYKQYLTCPNYIKKQFQRLASGFKVYGLNKETIAQIKVAFPKDKKEQEKIAQILMKWDEAIELQEQYIEKLKQYKAICLQKMFPRKGETIPEWRFKGFTDPWEQRKLGELSNVSTGFPFDSKDFADDGQYLVITNGNIQDASQNVDGSVGNRISVFDEKIVSTYLLNVGDILVTMDGTVGRTAKVIEKKQILAQRVGRIKATINGEFLYQWLNTGTFSRRMTELSHGGTIKHISLEEMRSFDSLIPCSDREQLLIGSFLGYFDNLITLHQHKHESLKKQRKMMQQLLLTGIVRVR